MLPSQVIILFLTDPLTDLETIPSRQTNTQQRQDKRTEMTKREIKDMSKLPAQTTTNPPNTTYLRPRPNRRTKRCSQPGSKLATARTGALHLQVQNLAEHNLGIIQGHQNDLDVALKVEGGTALRYGSKFNPPSILGLLLDDHPLWDSISSSLSNGIKYPLKQITCHARWQSIQQAINRGNHKSARDPPENLVEFLTSA
jgi:hypothetical protein